MRIYSFTQIETIEQEIEKINLIKPKGLTINKFNMDNDNEKLWHISAERFNLDTIVELGLFKYDATINTTNDGKVLISFMTFN